MEFRLMEVRGLVTACLSLRMSKRSHTKEYENRLRAAVRKYTYVDTGFIKPATTETLRNDSEYEFFIGELSKVAKYGAGIGIDSTLQAGHDTILRFIDFHVHVTGLHYAGMADLDSHAMRMQNRIVRSSSRLTTKGSATLSDWYSDKIVPMWETVTNVPEYIERDGQRFIYSGFGYVREDLLNDKDVLRGLYPLGMESDCIFAVDLFDMRHIYKRRNQYTHANPELKNGVEQLVDQIEAALPGDLGALVRNDYCSDNSLHHIMDIEKVYRP